MASDNALAIPLLKRAKTWLKKRGYVLADRGKNYSWVGATKNFQLKAKGRSIRKVSTTGELLLKEYSLLLKERTIWVKNKQGEY